MSRSVRLDYEALREYQARQQEATVTAGEGATAWHEMSMATNTPTLAQEPARRGTGAPTGISVATARHGGTTRGTLAQQAQTAHNTEPNQEAN